jgi:hypothetical protein
VNENGREENCGWHPPLRGTSTADSFGQKLSSLWIFWADPQYLSISPGDVVISLSGVCAMSCNYAQSAGSRALSSQTRVHVRVWMRCHGVSSCVRDPALQALFAPTCTIHMSIFQQTSRSVVLGLSDNCHCAAQGSEKKRRTAVCISLGVFSPSIPCCYGRVVWG